MFAFLRSLELAVSLCTLPADIGVGLTPFRWRFNFDRHPGPMGHLDVTFGPINFFIFRGEL